MAVVISIDMLSWQDSCLVHPELKGIELDLLRADHLDAKILARPESPVAVVALADVVGSRITHYGCRRVPRRSNVCRDDGSWHPAQVLLAATNKTLIKAPTTDRSATCKSCVRVCQSSRMLDFAPARKKRVLAGGDLAKDGSLFSNVGSA